jgi:hypothetical protein
MLLSVWRTYGGQRKRLRTSAERWSGDRRVRARPREMLEVNPPAHAAESGGFVALRVA